jgi:DNA-binding NarL/FixJ family response regulator
MSEIRVLVVDDHDLFRIGLSSLLAAERDIEVAGQASGGRSGVRLAHELRPDVVLMGLQMPDLPGPEATREILSDRRATRVVLLTVPSGDEDVEEAVLAGACGLLAKDTPIDEVASAVRAAAQGWPGSRPLPERLCPGGCGAPRGNGSHRTSLKRISQRASSKSCDSWPAAWTTKRSRRSSTSARVQPVTTSQAFFVSSAYAGADPEAQAVFASHDDPCLKLEAEAPKSSHRRSKRSVPL